VNWDVCWRNPAASTIFHPANSSFGNSAPNPNPSVWPNPQRNLRLSTDGRALSAELGQLHLANNDSNASGLRAIRSIRLGLRDNRRDQQAG